MYCDVINCWLFRWITSEMHPSLLTVINYALLLFKFLKHPHCSLKCAQLYFQFQAAVLCNHIRHLTTATKSFLARKKPKLSQTVLTVLFFPVFLLNIHTSEKQSFLFWQNLMKRSNILLAIYSLDFIFPLTWECWNK